MSRTIGWDIGGAHLKAFLLSEGHVKALQIPCELWRGLDKLGVAISSVLVDFGGKDAQHVVTMTGELVDLFQNRRQGVIEIANFAANMLGKDTRFYAAGHGFVDLEDVSEHPERIASTNWHASASLLAKYVKNALFVDIGSTTTDIILIAGGVVAGNSLSDGYRMKADTLVYTGVVRTPLMALAQKLPFDGQQVNVAAEYFSTMADVYRLTGELQAEMDMAETADGKGKSMQDSARRIARMVGHDVEDMPIETWKRLALDCKKAQIQQIKLAILKHWKAGTPIVGSGAGAFLVNQIAEELNCEYMTISQALNIDLNESLAVCFPAYAVAQLVVQQPC